VALIIAGIRDMIGRSPDVQLKDSLQNILKKLQLALDGSRKTSLVVTIALTIE
jgi:hypothetical protein